MNGEATTQKARVILHVDMDAFYASVELKDHPEWKGKPIIVGAGPNERGVVSAASYEARKFGVHSAMPSRQAGKLCPHGIFVHPRMERYEEESRKVFTIFDRFTPLIEPLSIDEAFLDVSGAIRLFGDGPTIARKIRAAIFKETGLTASIGVAPNKFLAKLASDLNKPNGLTLVPFDPGEMRRFIAPLPIKSLWGVGKVTAQSLERAGLRTIGDIQSIPLQKLSSITGQSMALHFKALAAGEDERIVETDWDEKSISREYTFDEDSSDPAEVRRILLELVDDVGGQLREAGKYATVTQIKLRWKGFETITRQTTLSEAICDDFTLRDAALMLFDRQKLIKPVRLIGFGVSGLSATARMQLSLSGLAKRDPTRMERLSRAVDGIRRKHGQASIKRLG